MNKFFELLRSHRIFLRPEYDRLFRLVKHIAGFYRRTALRRTRIVTVIGSLGKTTTHRAVMAALNCPDRKFSYSNYGMSLAENLLKIRPGDKFGALEVGIAGSNEMAPYAPMIFAGHRGARMSGVMRSQGFVLDGKPIRFQAKGRFATVRLVVRNYELTGRGPTTGVLGHTLTGDHWQNITIPTYLWEGEPAHFEVVQHGQLTHSRFPRDESPAFDENAYVAVRFGPSPDWSSWWPATQPTERLLQIWS